MFPEINKSLQGPGKLIAELLVTFKNTLLIILLAINLPFKPNNDKF